jgi:hypothetical protein
VSFSRREAVDPCRDRRCCASPTAEEWIRVHASTATGTDEEASAAGDRLNEIDDELAGRPGATLTDAVAKARIVAAFEREGVSMPDDGPQLAAGIFADLERVSGIAAGDERLVELYARGQRLEGEHSAAIRWTDATSPKASEYDAAWEAQREACDVAWTAHEEIVDAARMA